MPVNHFASSNLRVTTLVALCLLASGCDMLNIAENIKNPVAPPPPNRMLQDIAEREDRKEKEKSATKPGLARLGGSDSELSDAPEVRTADASDTKFPDTAKVGRAGLGKSPVNGWKQAGGSDIQQASFEEPGPLEDLPPASPKLKAETHDPQLKDAPTESRALLDTKAAAMVDGVPILVSDMLEPFSKYLAEIARNAPQMLPQKRAEIIQGTLRTHIEQQLLLNALKTKLKEEQLQSIEAQLQKAFDEELKTMYKQYGISTIPELEVELGKQHSSLQAVKAAFRNRHLARQWMAYRSTSKKVERGDLIAYYREHQKDYEFPTKFQWQQISIASEKHGGEAKAAQFVETLLKELEDGADFGELARKHSAGPTAAESGKWDWTSVGSLTDQKLEKLLLELPVNDIAGPHQTKQGFDIVRVTARQEGGRKGFESVQEKIREKLQRELDQSAGDKLLQELREQATIEILIKPEDLVEARKVSN